jgi:hypothetical protein
MLWYFPWLVERRSVCRCVACQSLAWCCTVLCVEVVREGLSLGGGGLGCLFGPRWSLVFRMGQGRAVMVVVMVTVRLRLGQRYVCDTTASFRVIIWLF